VGDTPERPIPSAADAFRANLRSFRFGLNDNNRSHVAGGEGNSGGRTNGANPTLMSMAAGEEGFKGTVGYAWVCVAHEVSEWEGADVRESLGAVLLLLWRMGSVPLWRMSVGGCWEGRELYPLRRLLGCLWIMDRWVMGELWWSELLGEPLFFVEELHPLCTVFVCNR
jgi:hypothetical protein